ncbi:hypothetical protein TWF694_001624 [Orbilia ellipsospora]|uniref:Uncharacterized protein n=1 Tax=Orbilia ellipsospora TaxID=2528407 RepID=A0AAV9X5L8_9PEZI
MSTFDYGTLGHVEYRSTTGEWHFLSRTRSPRDPLALGKPILVARPSSEKRDEEKEREKDEEKREEKEDGVKDGILKASNSGRQKVTQQFTSDHPIFAPAAYHIIDLFEESDAVQRLSPWPISRLGSIMTIVYASDHDNLLGGKHERRVLAYATGSIGQHLGIAAIGSQRLAGDNLIIRRPTIKQQSETVFTCNTTIEQIIPVCEVEKDNKRPYILLRTQSCIYVLQLKNETRFRDKALSFAVDLVGVLKITEAGGERFLHTAVNPWFGEQIALLDARGQLTLWQFNFKNTNRRTYAPLTPKQIFVGKTNSKDANSAVHWANLTWGSTQKDLVIAKRRELFILNIETGISTDIWKNVFPDYISDAELISLTRHPNKPGCLVLLTNYTLHLIEIHPAIKSVLIWRHCRHPEDRSLSCSIWNLDNDPCALLFSRYNPHITVLWGMQTRQSLDLSILVSKVLDSPLMGLVLLGGLVEEMTNQSRKKRAGIFSLLMIGSNYDIWSQEYTHDPNIENTIFRQNRKLKRAPLSSRIIDLSDEDSNSDGSTTATEDIDLDSSFKRLSLGACKREVSKAFSLDLKEIYNEAFDDESSFYKTGARASGRSFTDNYLGALRSILLNGDSNRTNESLTLLQLKTKLQGLFDDVGFLKTEIRNVCTAKSSKVNILDLESALTINSMSGMALACSKESHEASPTQQGVAARSLYDTLVGVWLGSLPTDSPAKLRLRRERIARMISGEIALSSIGLYGNGRNTSQGRAISLSGRDMEGESNMFQGDYPMEVEPSGASDMEREHAMNNNMSDAPSGMLIERFTPLTRNLVGSHDVNALLSDWDTEKTPCEYQWNELSTIWKRTAPSPSKLRSGSRKSNRHRQTASRPRGNRMLDSASAHEPPTTQPITSSEISAYINLVSSQATQHVESGLRRDHSGPRFPSSQTHRGKYGDSRRAKKRRMEGF